MAQTPEGAEKVAAGKAGVTIEEYRSRRASGLKRCTKCKSWKPSSGFNTDRSRFDGFAATCRRCNQRSDGPSDTERAIHRATGEEWCRGCRTWLPKSAMAGKQGACRACVNRERRVRYASDAGFRHRCKQSAYQRKRSVDAVPPEGERFLLMMFDGLCAYCSEPADSWDHITPVVCGGRTTPGNMVPACRSCNSSKKDADVWDWMAIRGINPSELLIDRIAEQDAGLFG